MKIIIDEATGTATASDADEGKENAEAKTAAVSTWNFSDADQLGKFMRGADQPDHPLGKASKGDLSAAQDMASQYAKQAKS